SFRMSAEDPLDPKSSEPKLSPLASDDVELVLEDEVVECGQPVTDPAGMSPKDDGRVKEEEGRDEESKPELHMSALKGEVKDEEEDLKDVKIGVKKEEVKEEDDDDDFLEIIEETEEEGREAFFRKMDERKKLADKFFDKESATSVAKLSPDMRTQMCRYAAAVFEWICCMPTPDLLAIIPCFADIETPFPVTASVKRALVRRELGVRVADVWRQTKSTVKLANHFKLVENVALLSLLDYSFANSATYEMDVLPLLKHFHIDRVDYHALSKFVFEYSGEMKKWKHPEEMILHTLLTPIATAILLTMLNAECVRAAPLDIPWESIKRDFTVLKKEDLDAYDDAIREALEVMGLEEPMKKARQDAEIFRRNMENNIEGMRAQEAKIREQMKFDKAVMGELKEKYNIVKARRAEEIEDIVPYDFEHQGEALAKDEEAMDADVRRLMGLSIFSKPYLEKADLKMEKGAKCWARRKIDALEPFEEAVFGEIDDEMPEYATVFFTSAPEQQVCLSLENLALGRPMSEMMAAVSEGVRVAAVTRHPLFPEKDALYSGTIISKYYTATAEYAVVFDDFFDDYVKIDKIYALMQQPFDANSGNFNRRFSYRLMSPNAAAPAPSKERRIFMMLYMAKYPEWNVMKMSERIGKNVSCYNREGVSQVAQVLEQDRLMVYLRFGDTQSFDTEQCLEFPCTKHKHHDEKMYRGNPRLKPMRTGCSFDKVLSIQTTFPSWNQSEMAKAMLDELNKSSKGSSKGRHARAHRTQGVMFEPAVPTDSHKSGTGVKGAQKARKCGTGLQVELMVPPENLTTKKDIAVEVLRHITPGVFFTVEDPEYRDSSYHEQCTHDCLKGMDLVDERILKDNQYSPYYVPITCGWRRHRQIFSFTCTNSKQQNTGMIFYRAPCGRPFYRMGEVAAFLKETGSELTVDLFTFSFDIDEAAYVVFDRKFLRLEDISGGSEGRPISVVNELDEDDEIPFIYRARRYPINERILLTGKEYCSGCDCTDDCSDWTKCACQRMTHRESYRTRMTFGNVTKGYSNRLLFERVSSGIYECNENCGCSRKRCMNRVVQNDMKVPMQMMKTHAMGWGVRALCDIPHGTYISCYHGAVLSDDIGELNAEGDEYYADLDFYNLAEQEKGNSGAYDHIDCGVYCDDPGARDLTEKEIAAIENDDPVTKFRKEVNDEKIIRKKEDRRLRAEKRSLEAAARAAREAENGANGAARAAVVNDVEMREEDVDEGLEEDGGDTEGEDVVDDRVGEGVGEGDSVDSTQDDEEESEKSKSPSPSEERKKEEKEKKAQLMEKGIKYKEAVESRFLLPMRDEDKEMNQLDLYFELAGQAHLFLLDAKAAGNIGRQFNHSCEPNMYTQHIFVDTHDIRLPWVAFFAKRDIKAGEELSWDYGWSVLQDNPRNLKCQCGAETCRVDLL
ncbi:met-2, partial [Pristionchus pacificus]